MALTYAETRDEENLRLLKPSIDDFVKQRQRPDNPASPCARQTVFFFPGGMASRLTRATKKFVDGAAGPPPPFNYKTVWVTPDTFVGGAKDLAMHRDSAGTFRDKGDRIIIANEAVGLLGCFPHNGLIDWAKDNNVDLFVFPWDWRRRLDETVTFFVRKFLPHLQAYVQSQGCPDPLARFALVGHSFGGMIANLILRGNDPIVQNLTNVITVATPFYGYSGQVHRWFEGEPYLNLFGTLEQDMMEMIATLPALYTLHHLDEETFNANETALRSGDFPIPGYPSMDESVGTLRADPYNPQTYASLVRYPGEAGFNMYELDYARLQFKTLASPMDPILLKKFHNIRGVKTKNDDKTPVDKTAGNVTWDWIANNFDADDETPIEDDDDKVPGDGTQPAWTTCLATNGDRCVTVKGKNIEHAYLMNRSGVLKAIQAILCPGGGTVSPKDTPEPEPASDEEIVDFLQWLSQNRLQVRGLEGFDDPRFRKLLAPRFSARLPNLATRFMSDVMKRPGPKGLRPPQEPPTPTTVQAEGPKTGPRRSQRKLAKMKES
jgi:hypothetical protein